MAVTEMGGFPPPPPWDDYKQSWRLLCPVGTSKLLLHTTG